jgi:hypothetical protein
MAAPIKSAAHIPATSPMNSPPRTMDFLLSDSVSHRSFEVIQIPQGAAGLWTGTHSSMRPASRQPRPPSRRILCYSTTRQTGPSMTVLVRRRGD